MSTARAAIKAMLTPHLPAGAQLVDYARQIDNLNRDLVMLRLDRVAPSTLAPQAWHDYAWTVVVATKRTDPGTADDQLDELLVDVLAALEAADLPAWTEAVRGVLSDSQDRPRWPAYEIRLTIPVETKEP